MCDTVKHGMTNENTIQPTPQFLTVKQVAARLSLSQRTVWSLATQGKIRALRLGKKCVRFDSDMLNEDIQKMAVPYFQE